MGQVYCGIAMEMHQTSKGEKLAGHSLCHVLIGLGIWLSPEALCSMRSCASKWHRLFMVEAFRYWGELITYNWRIESVCVWVDVGVCWWHGVDLSYSSFPKGLPVSSPALGITHKYKYIETHILVYNKVRCSLTQLIFFGRYCICRT